MTLDLRRLTPTYTVAPQIDPEDMAALKAAGYAMVINNRPDAEIAPDWQDYAMSQAAAKAGLAYVVNPVVPGDFSPEVVARQRAAIEAAGGPVLAYCASGNRSTVVWELVHAGQIPTDEMLAIAAAHGYQHAQFRALIEAYATK